MTAHRRSPIPPEIQHRIIELVSEDIIFPLTKKTIFLNIQLTSKTYCRWIKRFLYRVLDTEFLRAHFDDPELESRLLKDLTEFGKYTTHICFMTCEDDADLDRPYDDKIVEVIELCPNVEELLVLQPWDDNSGTYSDSLRLVDIHEVVKNLSKLKRYTGVLQEMTLEQLQSPVYQGITHLYVFGEVQPQQILQFKSLVQLNINLDGDDSYNETDMKVILDKKHGCQNLRAVIFIADLGYDLSENIDRIYGLDERQAAHECMDWGCSTAQSTCMDSANGELEDGFWTSAADERCLERLATLKITS